MHINKGILLMNPHDKNIKFHWTGCPSDVNTNRQLTTKHKDMVQQKHLSAMTYTCYVHINTPSPNWNLSYRSQTLLSLNEPLLTCLLHPIQGTLWSWGRTLVGRPADLPGGREWPPLYAGAGSAPGTGTGDFAPPPPQKRSQKDFFQQHWTVLLSMDKTSYQCRTTLSYIYLNHHRWNSTSV